MKTPRHFANHRPAFGSAAFVRGVAVTPWGYAHATRLGQPASELKLDRDEDRPYPGEACA